MIKAAKDQLKEQNLEPVFNVIRSMISVLTRYGGVTLNPNVDITNLLLNNIHGCHEYAMHMPEGLAACVISPRLPTNYRNWALRQLVMK